MAATIRINPPEHADSHPRYQPDCEFALEPSVTRLLENAEAVGWNIHQAAYAIMILSAAIVKKRDAADGNVMLEDQSVGLDH